MHPSGFVPFFRNKFQELFQDSSRTLIFPRLQISLRSFHSHFIFSTFQNKFSLRSTYKQAYLLELIRFPGPFQDLWSFSRTFQSWKKAKIIFQDFPGFLGPVRVQVLLSNLTEFSFVTAKKRTFGWMSKENAASEGQKYSFLKTRLELQRHNEGFYGITMMTHLNSVL